MGWASYKTPRATSKEHMQTKKGTTYCNASSQPNCLAYCAAMAAERCCLLLCDGAREGGRQSGEAGAFPVCGGSQMVTLLCGPNVGVRG